MKMRLEPKVRGFICTTTHPVGCEHNVLDHIQYLQKQEKIAGPKRVLVIGCSTGYGLASLETSLIACGAQTLGVAFERPASDKKPASPGWYNMAAFDKVAAKAGVYTKTIIGDAFSNEVKQAAIDIIQHEMGGQVDLVIYSLAAPKRKDPAADIVYSSALKPIGGVFENKTVDVMKGEVTRIAIAPATQTEIEGTIKVMGGEDWALWIEALLQAGVLSQGCMTVAYSYIGPEITYSVYRHGTIGKAKEDLEKTALQLDKKLQETLDGHAYVSVNKAVVTQASAAIPVVPLYISLLYKVMKDKKVHEGCIEQIYRLFSTCLYRKDSIIPVDEAHRIRIDDAEMAEDVQQEVLSLWEKVTTENLAEISDIVGYREEFYQLFGFHREDIDYNKEVEIEVKNPSVVFI